MRTIGMVTSSRADWGIQRCIAEALSARDDVRLDIVACGMHLADAFGHTVDQIVADGFEVAHRVDFLEPGDSPTDIGASMGIGVERFAQLFARWQPDVLTVLGDRFDMFPAVLAATPHLIPVAHLHGGELTTGAFDDALRHAITKLSHIHLCSTEEYARRIRQMGEEPERVHVVGAPGLDDILRLEPIADERLDVEFGFRGGATNVLVVYHPETLAYEQAARDAECVLAAASEVDGPLVVLRPNADTGNRAILGAIEALCARRPDVRTVENLDRRTFLSLMRRASVMIGNSSSGILEAPSFALPVVNVGARQSGRVRAANVIDCPAELAALRDVVRRATSPDFRASLRGLVNPYGDGKSGPRIAGLLATIPITRDFVRKRFVDIPTV